MTIMRIKYKKQGNLKFISHLELMKTVERIFRRMQLPLKFSQGFNPHPKISFAAPLPVGVSSEAEFLDAELTEEIDLKEMLATQKQFLPNGLEFVEATFLEKSSSLMSLVEFSEYVLNLELSEDMDEEAFKSKLESFLNREEILFKKKNKKGKMTEKNIRELIFKIDFMTKTGNEILLRTKLKTGSNGNLKPEILIALMNEYDNLGAIDHKLRIHRISLSALKKDEEINLFEAK